MRFVVDSVALGNVLLLVLLFSPVIIIPLLLRTRLQLHVALITWTNGRKLGAFHKAMLFRKSGRVS